MRIKYVHKCSTERNFVKCFARVCVPHYHYLLSTYDVLGAEEIVVNTLGCLQSRRRDYIDCWINQHIYIFLNYDKYSNKKQCLKWELIKEVPNVYYEFGNHEGLSKNLWKEESSRQREEHMQRHIQYIGDYGGPRPLRNGEDISKWSSRDRQGWLGRGVWTILGIWGIIRVLLKANKQFYAGKWHD